MNRQGKDLFYKNLLMTLSELGVNFQEGGVSDLITSVIEDRAAKQQLYGMESVREAIQELRQRGLNVPEKETELGDRSARAFLDQGRSFGNSKEIDDRIFRRSSREGD